MAASSYALLLFSLVIVPMVTTADINWNQKINNYYQQVERVPTNGSTVRRISGNLVKSNHFPHHVYIRLKNDTSQTYCSGAIVDKNYVLTAAHCVMGFQITQVIAGVVNIADNKNSISREVVKVELYPRQASQDIVNDIALLQVEPGFPDDLPGVAVVPIRKTRPRASGSCLITGWGRFTYSKHMHLESLKSPLWPDFICKGQIKNFKIDTICSGNAVEGADNCLRDRASTLMCNGELVGVANIGIPCGRSGSAQSFTDVSYYAEWIDRTLYNVESIFGSGDFYIDDNEM